MLELDHVIWFVPGRETARLDGFTIEPGRVHRGQGTRNVRVLFERNYLEVLWIEHPDEVMTSGMDFGARCARPPSRYPFGCVLRGTIPEADRPRFVKYELPDVPGFELQILAVQPPDAPFVAVFETTEVARAWPRRRAPPEYLVHPNGAHYLACATFVGPAEPPLTGLTDVRFLPGPPRLELDLGIIRVSLKAHG